MWCSLVDISSLVYPVMPFVFLVSFVDVVFIIYYINAAAGVTLNCGARVMHGILHSQHAD